MSSIRTKTMLLTAFAIVISMTVSTLLGVVFIRQIGSSSAADELDLLCEKGQEILDSTFLGVEKSVDMVSDYIRSELLENPAELTDEQFARHMDRAEEFFGKMAEKTPGVLTYYYRVDPEFSGTVKGFWYTNLDGKGFRPHEVTDITQYDTENTDSLVWFTNPKKTGRPLWLSTYVTDNLDDVLVISYNEPIYMGGPDNETFVGVVGIELDYNMFEKLLSDLTLYDNGYAFVTDEHGKLIYHPHIDVPKTAEKDLPKQPTGLIGKSETAKYRFANIEKQASRRSLINGMLLTVSVPVAEINSSWHRLILILSLVAVWELRL